MRTIPYSGVLNNICGLIGVPLSRLTQETADAVNNLFYSNVRQLWGRGNWTDISPYGEARFVGNLLTYSNDLSKTAYWTATNLTVTANSIGNPADNRVTASKLAETVTNGQHKVVQSGLAAFPTTQYQLSVYVRPNGRNYVYVAANDGVNTYSAFFNVQGGVVGTCTNLQNWNIQQNPNGFYLCTLTYQTASTAASQSVTIATSTDGSTLSYAGDPTKGLYAWGALLVQTTNVSPQQFTLPPDQTGETEIDQLFTAWVDNPAMVTYPRNQGFVVTDQGYQMISSAGGFMGTNGYVTYNTNPANPIYIYYRKAPYTYQGDVFDATATYVADQYVYYTWTTGARKNTSDFYRCSEATSAGETPESAPNKWELQPIPEQLFNSLVWQTYADWLVQDGQAEKATQAYAIADQKANEEWDRIERQSPNSWQMRVFTHCTSENRAW